MPSFGISILLLLPHGRVMHEGDAWGPWGFLWLMAGIGMLAISEAALDIWLLGSLIVGAVAFVYVTLIDG